MVPTVARRSYTDEQRAEALELYAEQGPTQVEAQLGIPASTVMSWARAAGVHTMRAENARVRNEARAADLEQRRLDLALGLFDDIARLRSQLFAPCTLRKPMAVSDGREVGSHIEIVDVELDQPTFSEQTRIMTSIGIAVDKAQLLTGQATARIETSGGASIDDEVAALAAELELTGVGPA